MNYMQIVPGKNVKYLDPRTKFVMLFCITMTSFSVRNWYVLALAAVISLSLFLFQKRYLFVLLLSAIFSLSLLSYVYLLDNCTGFLSIITAMITGVVNRMGPNLLLGYYVLTTTTVSEFIAAMERLHLPKHCIIPLSVMLRFFPTIKEEATSINEAMKMRGITCRKSKGNLFLLIEYRLIPLCISCVKIGEELSCSALTRALGSPIKRTNICKVGFRFFDWVYLMATAIILVLFFMTKRV